MSQVNGGNGWRGRLWAYAPVFLWIGVIFLLSSPHGSLSETSRIIGPLLSLFFPEMPDATRQIVHGYVRKAAHFTEYAVLAFLAVRACMVTASLVRWRYLLALSLVILVAFLDEFHQSFYSSRSGSMWDVALDISGGLFALGLIWLVKTRMNKV